MIVKIDIPKHTFLIVRGQQNSVIDGNYNILYNNIRNAITVILIFILL